MTKGTNMIKKTVMILGIVLLASCASNRVQDYREPPNMSEWASYSTIPASIVNPRYPRKAAVKRIEGWVHFEFELNAEGKPINITVLDSFPEKTFVKEALKSISQWTFKPADPSVSDKKHQYLMEFKIG